MSFGLNCEYATFEDCVKNMRGRVKDPIEYCAVLMKQTQNQCRGGEGTSASTEEESKD